jgi:Zn-dependent protease with chaperone function
MIAAIYFDGKSAKAQPAKIAIQSDSIAIFREGEEPLRHPLAHARIDEAFKGSAQKIDLGGGAVLEVSDSAALQVELDRVGLKLSLVQNAQNSWVWVGGCFLALLGLLVAGYLYLIPFVSKHVAAWLPESVDKALGDQAWPLIETQMFKPSTLSAERQKSLSERYAQITRQLKDPPHYELLFRASAIGPNAIAIPGGRLIMTDELVALSKNDDALMGVLLHELGHIKNRHSMRNVLQAAAVTAVISVWLGDVSSLVTAIPAAMASMKYSRDLETEADDFAIAAMRALRIPGQPTADLFAELERAEVGKRPSSPGKENKDGDNKDEGKTGEAKSAKPASPSDTPSASESIFSSHPVTRERIKKFSELK